MCEGPGRSQFFDDTDTESTGGLIEQVLDLENENHVSVRYPAGEKTYVS